MSLFSRLFGKKSPPVPEAPAGMGLVRSPGSPPPPILNDDGESPWVVVDLGGMVSMMDRETYEYMYFSSDAPNPSQRDLDELMPTVTRARVFAGGLYRGRPIGGEVLIDTTDSSVLAELRAALQLAPATSFSRCACQGGPCIELLAGESLAATIGLQHGNAIRWKKWKEDGPLADGARLSRWLTDHGVAPDLLNRIYHNQHQLGMAEASVSPAEQRARQAEVYRQQGDRARALEEAEAALRDEPDLPLARAIRAALRGASGDHAGAVADCDVAIRGGFRSAEVFFTRALSQGALERIPEAETDCTAAIEADPRHVNAWNSRGIFRMQLGRFDQALTDFAETMRLAPDWELPHANRSNVHLAQGNLDAAIADLTRFLELAAAPGRQPNPRMLAMAHWNRGQCYQQKGDTAPAEADFREATAHDPGIASRPGG